MSPLYACFLFAAGALGGGLNAVAGGGILMTLPALLVGGANPIAANATSTIALWPGSLASVGAYREELKGQHRRLIVPLGAASVAGGSLGAALLLHTSQAAFSRLVPYLLLAATLLFAFGRPLGAWLHRHAEERPLPDERPRFLPMITAMQFAIAVYGGYFGGGSILMLASLALIGMDNIHMMNALRTVLVTCVTGAAVVSLVLGGAVLWPQAVLLTLGAATGGYAGARWARRLPPELVRRFVILVGSAITLYFFQRTW